MSPYDRFVQYFRGIDRALLDGKENGMARSLLNKGTDQIVGATIVAQHAGDLIGEIALAMTHELGLKKVSNTIHPYPTQAERFASWEISPTGRA